MKMVKSRAHKTVPSIWSHLEPRSNVLFEAETNKGNRFYMWKSQQVSGKLKDSQRAKGINTQYACHGYTVGSHALEGGPFTPYANGIDIVLDDEFSVIHEADLRIGDVIAWHDEDGLISHTARIQEIYWGDEQHLADTTRVSTKNGAHVFRERSRLATVKIKYGDSLSFYRESTGLQYTPPSP